MFPFLVSLYEQVPCTTVICQKYLDSNASQTIIASAQPIVYQSPITITKGGTYRGNWQSLNANVAAVTIKTSEPVIIENSKVRGRGHLIQIFKGSTNVTVRNTYGYGLNPKVVGRIPGRFLDIDMPVNIVVENCYMQSTSGISLYNGSANQSVKIRYNRVRNIDGRKSDGKDGFIAEFDWSQFVQLNQMRHVRGVEIAWNEVINEPYKSRVEDNISIYRSSGTSSSPILIHNNYIQGGYPANPARDEYSGGGIMLGDGSSSTISDAVGFVWAYNNHVVSTTNYGIAISAGHNNKFYNNRIISSGLLPNGTRLAAQNVGSYIWDINGDIFKGTFHNNFAHDNTIGWFGPNGARNDMWLPGCESGKCKNNKSLPNPISRHTEEAEFQIWLKKVASNKVVIGPNF